MQTLEEYKMWYAQASRDSMIQEIFNLSQTNFKLNQINMMLANRQKVIDWNMRQKSQQIEDLETENIHLKDKFDTLHNPDAVTTPRIDMLACLNPYMIEEHTKKKNNASEST
jgi:hypothetical protein